MWVWVLLALGFGLRRALVLVPIWVDQTTVVVYAEQQQMGLFLKAMGPLLYLARCKLVLV